MVTTGFLLCPEKYENYIKVFDEYIKMTEENKKEAEKNAPNNDHLSPPEKNGGDR